MDFCGYIYSSLFFNLINISFELILCLLLIL